MLLRHFDGDRLKAAEERAAAERSAADAEAADHLRFVAHADLTQLNARAEHARKVFYQLAEVHAAVRREVKEDFTVVKRVLHVDKLHFESALRNFLFALRERIFCFQFIFRHAAQVVFCRLANYFFERLHNGIIRNIAVGHRHFAALYAARRFYNDVVVGGELLAVRVKVIHLAHVLKTNTDYFCHIYIHSP